MECERLKKLVKNWYLQVQDESMAPARMVDFMNSHVHDCIICMGDPLIEIEVKRITEIVLPPTKIPKAVRKDQDESGEDQDDPDDPEDSDDVSKDDDDDIDPDEEDEEEEDEEDEI